jgi:glycosyltransferase involved in cell wall biosynthesis
MATRESRLRLSPRKSTPSGAGACRNQGYDESSGEFVIFLDSDDVLSSGCIAGRVEAFALNRQCDAVIAQGLIFRESPGDQNILWNACEYPPRGLVERFLDQDMPWQTTGPLWRKEAIAEILWDIDLESFQDWDFHLRACIHGAVFHILPFPDFYIRRDPNGARISSRHFDEMHIRSRCLAAERVADTLASAGKLKGTIKNHLKAFLIRNMMDLIDQGCGHFGNLFMKTAERHRLINRVDRGLLSWIDSVGASWRYDRRVAAAARAWWRNIPFDSHRIALRAANTWPGPMPEVRTVPDELGAGQ